MSLPKTPSTHTKLTECITIQIGKEDQSGVVSDWDNLEGDILEALSLVLNPAAVLAERIRQVYENVSEGITGARFLGAQISPTKTYDWYGDYEKEIVVENSYDVVLFWSRPKTETEKRNEEKRKEAVRKRKEAATKRREKEKLKREEYERKQYERLKQKFEGA